MHLTAFKILLNYFQKKIVIARWELNILMLIVVSSSLLAGAYIATTEMLIPKIFAASSWIQTDWSSGVGSSTSNQYSAISNIDATGTSGQLTLANPEKLSNTGFETDLTSWDGGAAPSSISGLAMWYKADAITNLTDGASVFTWPDSSGNGWTASQNSSFAVPIYKTNIINSKPVVRFGSNSVLTSLIIGSQTMNARTIFAVANKLGTSIGANHSIILQMGIPFYQFYSPSGTSTMRFYVNGDLAGDNFTTTPQLLVGKSSLSGSTFYMNGIQKASSSNTSSSQTATFEMGSYTPNNYGLNGDVGEIIIFNSALSDTDRIKVEGYLQAKYALGSTEVTLSRDTNIKYAGSAAMKMVSGSAGGPITQSVNVGDTNTYNLIAYVYKDSTAVSSSDVSLYYNGSTVSTTYTSVGAGWYKLTGTVTGANASRQYGVTVAANKTLYIDNFSVSAYASSGTLTSNIFDSSQPSAWGVLSYTSSGSTVTVKARTSNSAAMVGATAFSSCTAITSGSDISSNNCVTDGDRYIQYQVSLSTSDTLTTPTFSDVTINYDAYDSTPPITNASSIVMSSAASGGRNISSNGWNNTAAPYFSWTAGADNVGGSGLKGYCLYLGTDSAGDPATAKGVLGTSPVSTSGSTCQFIISSTNIDLSTSGYIGSALVSGSTYYLNIKAIDNGYNTFASSAVSVHFREDVTTPINVTSISTPGSGFANVVDMYFSWPVSGGTAAADTDSGLLGYQYQINSTSGTWLGTATDATCGVSYIPAATSSYALTSLQDGSSISVGNNTVYFRVVDVACNTSQSATYRTGLLQYGGSAPTFGGGDSVSVAPSTNTSNSFAFSWPAASAGGGRSITHYYYMVNITPPSTLSTITSNAATYIDNGTSRNVSAGNVSGAVKGSNTVYVVAVDDASNYSPSNVITGTFTLDSTIPDPPKNLAVTDSSIKSSSLWRASLGWDVPDYKGTGSLTYKIQRSTDGSSWSDVTTTTGTSYIDTVSDSKLYYWRVGTYDTSASSQSAPSFANAVSLTPKGTFTSAPGLSSGPTVSSITTKSAKITWSTSRDADSKVQYGISAGTYYKEEPSNSSQVTDHTINLTNLSPGVNYYFRVKWTDEDGNTGTSDEKTFATTPPPSISAVTESDIGLSSALINFTVKDASKVTIFYGKSTSYGGTNVSSTSTSNSSYSVKLSGLDDGSIYHYKLKLEDADGNQYDFEDHQFQTLPRPKISGVRIQQVVNSAQPTILVSWTTNTDVSSIVTYYPESQPSLTKDEVNVSLVKGEHKLIVRGLFDSTPYSLIVKGRDKAGNEASSDIQRVTTSTDTRPPQISELHVEGSNIPSIATTGQEQTAQLVVTWNTDEPSTSQVEFGEGSGTTYAQKTQEDANLTTNHLVVISSLTPSKVYHLKALSKDKANNLGQSIDTVNITPKATDNALNLVLSNLQEVFGFLKGLGQ